MEVLYVDDDLDDLQLFREALEEIDPSIVCLMATTGQEALTLLRSGASPDLIFIDVVMPEMDGVTFLTKMRQIDPLCASKAVLMSVSFYNMNEEIMKRLGASFIKKPDHYNDLVVMLTNYLNKDADNLPLSKAL